MSDQTDQKWRNRGAPFDLPDGRRVGRGDVFSAAPGSRSIRMRKHKLVPVAPNVEVTVEAAEDPGPRVTYPGIDFGSSQAYELAREAGLTTRDLGDMRKTGQPEHEGEENSVLVGDVRRYLAENR